MVDSLKNKTDTMKGVFIMGRKGKVPPESKIWALKTYLVGEKSMVDIREELQVHVESFRNWINKYQVYGEPGLLVSNKNTQSPEHLKRMAISDYLNGHQSLERIWMKYEIKSQIILRHWIKKYNHHGKITSCHIKGEGSMTKGRKTTYEERLAIVADCIENQENYQKISKKYEVSYQQVYSWVKKYKQDGTAALVDRRGKNKIQEALTESEQLTA